ncbi:MAG: hypothetical protein ACOY3N_01950 [Bradyrhizobium sp.]
MIGGRSTGRASNQPPLREFMHYTAAERVMRPSAAFGCETYCAAQ